MNFDEKTTILVIETNERTGGYSSEFTDKNGKEYFANVLLIPKYVLR